MGLPVRRGVELPDMDSRFECRFPNTPDEEGVLALAAFAISSEIMPLLLLAFASQSSAQPPFGLTLRQYSLSLVVLLPRILQLREVREQRARLVRRADQFPLNGLKLGQAVQLELVVLNRT